MVREARLELAHLAAPEPKSGASTNFATPAYNLEKKRLAQRVSLSNMAGIPGFEPGNARIKTWCLTAWRYPKNGGYDGIRTCHPNIMSVVL